MSIPAEANSLVTAAWEGTGVIAGASDDAAAVGEGSARRGLKVVLIAYAYPPYKAAGSARAVKVAEALRRDGHSVYVITSRIPGEPAGPRVERPGLTVQAVSTLPHPRRLLGALKNRFGRVRSGVAGNGAPEPDPDDGAGKHRAGWKRHLLSLLLLPDDVQGFIPPAVLHAMGRAVGGIDLVYTTSPPASSHLAGLILKLLTGAPWITEFRDPWYPQRGPLTSWERHRIEGWLERQCIRRADRVISVTDGIDEMLRSRLEGHGAERCLVVRNGIDELRSSGDDEGVIGQERILYLGTLYWKRSPWLFLQGLAVARDRLGSSPAELRVDFVGNCRSLGSVPVENLVRELGLDGYVHFHDWLPHEEARRMLERATLLLLLAQEQPIQVPNKLYEYLGTRKPIIALADDGGETARMLRRVGGHYLATERDDVDTMVDLLERALRRPRRSRPDARRDAVLEDWTTARQMRRLVETIRSDMAPRGRGLERSPSAGRRAPG